MFSGRASLGPTGRRTYSTRETQLLVTENGFRESGTKKERIRKNNKEWEKHRSPKSDSIIAPALDVRYSCTAYVDVQYSILLSPATFCLGRRPCDV